MSIKPRSPGQTAISVSIPAALLEEIDQRAGALGLNRSQYLTLLARRDVESRGDLTLSETPKVPAVPPAGRVTYRRRKPSSVPPSRTEHKIVAAVRQDLKKPGAPAAPPKESP